MTFSRKGNGSCCVFCAVVPCGATRFPKIRVLGPTTLPGSGRLGAPDRNLLSARNARFFPCPEHRPPGPRLGNYQRLANRYVCIYMIVIDARFFPFPEQRPPLLAGANINVWLTDMYVCLCIIVIAARFFPFPDLRPAPLARALL